MSEPSLRFRTFVGPATRYPCHPILRDDGILLNTGATRGVAGKCECRRMAGFRPQFPWVTRADNCGLPHSAVSQNRAGSLPDRRGSSEAALWLQSQKNPKFPRVFSFFRGIITAENRRGRRPIFIAFSGWDVHRAHQMWDAGRGVRTGVAGFRGPFAGLPGRPGSSARQVGCRVVRSSLDPLFKERDNGGSPGCPDGIQAVVM